MWKFEHNKWQKEENWLTVPLQWGACEKAEYGNHNKFREERNTILHRPYYFVLGKTTTSYVDKFIIYSLPKLAGQIQELDLGEYCFGLTVTGEEIDPPPKFIYVIWHGGCTGVSAGMEVSMTGIPPV